MYRVKRKNHIFYKPSWVVNLMLSFTAKNFEWKNNKDSAIKELNNIKNVLINNIFSSNNANPVKYQYRTLKVYDDKIVISSRTGKPMISFTLEEAV